MTRKFSISILILILILFGSQATEFQVSKSRQNLVKFVSDAPVESFEGITDQIDGYIYWEGEDLTQNSELYFEVDLNTLDTGIGLRNRHMRDNYLETDKFPRTYYKGKIISAQKKDENTYQVQVEGLMFIHGVEKPLSVNGTISREEEGIFRIHTTFEVKLSDYKIKIPKLMFFKIDERMQLELDFYVEKITEQE